MNRLRFTLILASIGLISAAGLLSYNSFAQIPLLEILDSPGIQVPAATLYDTSATVTFTTSVATCAYITYSPDAGIPAATSTRVGGCEMDALSVPIPPVQLRTNFAIALNGLNPSSTYYYTVTLINAAGVIFGAPSAAQDFTTTAVPSLTTPTEISNPSAANITETSATITFDTNQAAGQHIDCFAINYGLSPTSTYPRRQAKCYTVADPDPNTTDHSITLNNLVKGRIYDYTIWITDENGTKTSAPLSFTTAGDAPIPTGPLTSSSVSITAVNVDFVKDDSAAISFKYSSVLPGTLCYRALYGRTTAYSDSVTSQSLDPVIGSKSISLSGLDVGTAYHFVIQIVKAGGLSGCTDEVVLASADRSFTTGRESADQSVLLINKIRLDCTDTSCIVYYSTNKSATVEIRWDDGGTEADRSFGGYQYHILETADLEGERTVRIPDGDPDAPAFERNTMYKYRLQATDADGAQNTTSQLSFTTSTSSTDHTFATGNCGGIEIGQCSGTQYCQSAGLLVEDCTQCGFICDPGMTCRAGAAGGTCNLDTLLTPGSASQCNNSACYEINGALKNPARAGCYSTWPSCNANTVLSVRKDRGCNLWLTCGMSVQVDGRGNAPSENICFSLATCNSLNTRGQCNHYLPLGQCNNDPVRFCSRNADCQDGGICNSPSRSDPTRALQTATFQTPKDIAKIANLSGDIAVGLDWGQQGGANVIQGMLPWQLMPQVGTGVSADTWKNIITNGDFEYDGPNPWPWGAQSSGTIQIDFEDREAGPNHVLYVNPKWSSGLTYGGESGAISQPFTASADDYYYVEARVRSGLYGVSAKLKMQLALGGGTTDVSSAGAWAATVIKTTDTWQTISIGPIKGIYGMTTVRFVCFSNPDASGLASQRPNVTDADGTYCNPFEIDDVIVKPVLQINNNPNYITPSCRLYPKTNSPACDYVDESGTIYNGWKGYCLERDSVAGTCISWWPVDMIKGESSLFGAEKTAGYADRVPLFLCAEAAGGSAGGKVIDTSRTLEPPVPLMPEPFSKAQNQGIVPSCTTGEGYLLGRPYSFLVGETPKVGLGGTVYQIAWLDPLGQEVGMLDYDITKITLLKTPAPLNPDGTRMLDADGVQIDGTDGNALVWPNLIINTDRAGNVINEPPYPSGLYNDDTPLTQNTWQGIGTFVPAIPATATTPLIPARWDVDSRNSHTQVYSETWPSIQVGAAGNTVGKHCDDQDGCTVWIATTDKGYTGPQYHEVAGDGQQVHNYMRLYVVFGNSDGILERYGYESDDIIGNACEPGSYQLTFLFSDGCKKIVQVVQADGTNKAFSSRVTSSIYRDPADFFPTGNPGALQSKDPTPFSSVVLPDGYSDPTGAPAIPIETEDLLSPQPRSGVYACTGNCVIAGTTASLLVSQKGPQSFTTAQCIGGRCTGGSCGAPQPAVCNVAEQVTSKPSLSAEAAETDARIKCGLSFSGIGIGNRVACDGDVGSCTGEKKYYDGYLETSNNQNVAGLYVSIGNCQVSGGNQIYTVGNPVTDIDGDGVEDFGAVPPACQGNANCRANWDDYTDLRPRGGNPGQQSKYFAQERIKRIFAQSYGIWTLQGGVYTKVPNSDAGSDNFVGWNPPAEICPENTTPIDTAGGIRAKYIRPSYIGIEPLPWPQNSINTQRDYCGIPPEVYNTKFGVGLGRSVTIIGGSGNVAIKFNTTVDAEQMPLREIRVDWGDGQDAISYPYAPRSDPAKPHILSHVYVMSNGLVEDCPVDDTGRVVCVFHIKIQVIDKWGWCNDAHVNDKILNLSAKICHEAKLGDGQYDSSDWFDTGLSVRVEP